MYWDTYCVLHTLKIIGLVSFKAPLCKSKCELPPSFWTSCDFHVCLTCAWNMFLLQKKITVRICSECIFCCFWKAKLHILQIRCGNKNSLRTSEMSVDWDEINSKLPFARTKVLLHLCISSSPSSIQWRCQRNRTIHKSLSSELFFHGGL